ncbi:MAG TPA: hypothetical protein VJS20_08990 [Gemmatimonadales bacterium]|nr:hypothetical protein [Gemmatimonadales bacterium]
MLAPFLLLTGLTSCGSPPSVLPCDTTRIDVGIWRARHGAAYALVPHRGGYLFVVRVVGSTATVVYPQSPVHQMTTWAGDTLKIADTAWNALRTGEVTLVIHWSSTPFALPSYTAGDTWDNAGLSETWVAIQAQTGKTKYRLRELDGALAGSEDAVVLASVMNPQELQSVAQQMMAAWRPTSVYPSGGLSAYQAAHPNAPDVNAGSGANACTGQQIYAAYGSSGMGTRC